MCGIAGFAYPGISESGARPLIQAMTRAIAHRGPDGEGFFIDQAAGLALGHRRLSIIDLSEAGAQPMTSSSGQYTVVFNGEIYNFRTLRRVLADRGASFRGSSDTEVLLQLIEAQGVYEATKQLDGMFAFAVWDKSRRVLSLVRDRLGEKPLFIGLEAGGLWFSSELKSRTAIGYAPPELDTEALGRYLRFGYVPDPQTIYAGVFSVPAATILEFPASILDAGGCRLREHAVDQIRSKRYWRYSLRSAARTSPRSSTDTTVTDLDVLLTNTIENELVADVPIGCFLSGGIDSSLVTGIAQKLSARPVKTFTIGFDNPSFDESAFSREVADHLGTEHHCRVVTGKDALDCVQDLPQVFDQPFANASALCSLLLAKYASEQVKVCLTGDGADEVFVGYNRYLYPPRIKRWIDSPIGPVVRRVARFSAGSARQGFSSLSRVLGKIQNVENKLQKFAKSMSSDSEFALFEELISILDDEVGPQLLRDDDLAGVFREPLLDRSIGFFDSARQFDLNSYLPGDNLSKVDRTAMRYSLETRSPFMDHKVVDFGLSLTMEQLVSASKGKIVLRKLLSDFIPTRMIDRPKMGFSVPIDDWLTNDLRSLIDDVSAPQFVSKQGLFEPQSVNELRRAHAERELNSGVRLWAFLIFQLWYRDSYQTGRSKGLAFRPAAD